jgi:hypothetical protein
MALTTHTARIMGPVAYYSSDGDSANIPLGPCLVEEGDGQHVEIIWGVNGQNSTMLPIDAMENAEVCGHLLLLD